MNEPQPTTPAPDAHATRRMAGSILIVGAVALVLGATLKIPVLIGANDISRWCTVWSLLERGTYAIDECPWQSQTQDKVRVPEPFPSPGAEPRYRFYSSKPPLLPTLIAGLLYPFRVASGVPLDAVHEQQRVQRKAVESLDYEPTEKQKVLEIKGDYKIIDITLDPYKWPANVFYFDFALVLLNVLPFGAFLLLYARFLDNHAPNDWAWLASLGAAALGTNLTLFSTTLNNHTIAAFSAIFAVLAWLRALSERQPPGWLFVAAGFFAAFAACNELPAAAFGGLLFLALLGKDPRRTLTLFVPAAALPLAAFFLTMYLATGGFVPVYAEFKNMEPGSPYYYSGSYWLTPLGADALNEPKWLYFFHMTFGHHGVFSLTPVFLFAFWGLCRELRDRSRPLWALAVMTVALTLIVGGFYLVKTNNYGGSTQGLRWLFWLFPFWLLFLPSGLASGGSNRWPRRLGLAALGLSIFNTGYGLILPWSHPWYLDLIEHLGIYPLVR